MRCFYRLSRDVFITPSSSVVEGRGVCCPLVFPKSKVPGHLGKAWRKETKRRIEDLQHSVLVVFKIDRPILQTKRGGERSRIVEFARDGENRRLFFSFSATRETKMTTTTTNATTPSMHDQSPPHRQHLFVDSSLTGMSWGRLQVFPLHPLYLMALSGTDYQSVHRKKSGTAAGLLHAISLSLADSTSFH